MGISQACAGIPTGHSLMQSADVGVCLGFVVPGHVAMLRKRSRWWLGHVQSIDNGLLYGVSPIGLSY